MFHIDTVIATSNRKAKVVRDRQEQGLPTLHAQVRLREFDNLRSDPDVFERDLLEKLDQLAQRLPRPWDEGLLDQRRVDLLTRAFVVTHTTSDHNRRRAVR